MPKYEALPTIKLIPNSSYLHRPSMPEIAHIDDHALEVMIDFTKTDPPVIHEDDSLDKAQLEIQACGLNLLLVIDQQENIVGLVSSEDILGEKPIKITQERRIERSKILVKMVMTKQQDILALDLESLSHARLANIINTLKKHNQHYALVVRILDDGKKQRVRGMFSLLTISKQLHMDITTITEAHSVAELQKRHT